MSPSASAPPSAISGSSASSRPRLAPVEYGRTLLAPSDGGAHDPRQRFCTAVAQSRAQTIGAQAPDRKLPLQERSGQGRAQDRSRRRAVAARGGRALWHFGVDYGVPRSGSGVPEGGRDTGSGEGGVGAGHARLRKYLVPSG